MAVDKRTKSALDESAGARHSTLERLADIAARTEAARVGLTREVGKLEADVKALEAERAKRAAAQAVEFGHEKARLHSEMLDVTTHHGKVCGLHDALLARIERVRNTVA